MSKKIITKEEFNELSKVMDPLEIIQIYNIETTNVEILHEEFKIKPQNNQNLIRKINRTRIGVIVFFFCFFALFCHGAFNNWLVSPEGLDYSVGLYFVFILIPYLIWLNVAYTIYLKFNNNIDMTNTRYKTISGVIWRHLIGFFQFHSPYLVLNELWNNKRTDISFAIVIFWIIGVFDSLLLIIINRNPSIIIPENSILALALYFTTVLYRIYLVYMVTEKQIDILNEQK